ncbi:cysteine desulfurase family protein [uncultured Clostridium sp.]|uniref:cysteine desulfurase family protein n=1 Tax=uncultured Clostridium sp. TaxID=59620 RepID=UPI0026371594|nr:cysteine desulfurase family protein [uncultured Clostridium sp.]
MEVYFDNSATTKPYREVIDEVVYGMENFYGNPSSLHALGIKAEKELTKARKIIGEEIKGTGEEIYFISGASEGNNLVFKGIARSGQHIITTKFEHQSILKTCEFLEKEGVSITYLNVDNEGKISLEELKNAITKNTVLVSIMFVNNEMGAIQDLEKIGNIIKENSTRAKFHVDAVQGYGKFKIDVKKMKIDILTTTGHKFHGPKGTGFIYIRKGININSLIHGGEQENSLRAGTQNIAGILGLKKAAEIVSKNIEINYKKVFELKKYMIEKISEIEDIRINSPLETTSPYILNISFNGVRAEVLLHYLEGEGIYVSTGSACTSKSSGVNGSYVIKALGLCEKEVNGAIRFSFSENNTKEEVDYTIDVLKKGLKFLRRVKK